MFQWKVLMWFLRSDTYRWMETGRDAHVSERELLWSFLMAPSEQGKQWQFWWWTCWELDLGMYRSFSTRNQGLLDSEKAHDKNTKNKQDIWIFFMWIQVIAYRVAQNQQKQLELKGLLLITVKKILALKTTRGLINKLRVCAGQWTNKKEEELLPLICVSINKR